MLTYSRFVPAAAGEDAVEATTAHVRAHLSSVADADDDPCTRAEDVVVELVSTERGTRVLGRIDAEPTADYLDDRYDPYSSVPDELRAEATR